MAKQPNSSAAPAFCQKNISAHAKNQNTPKKSGSKSTSNIIRVVFSICLVFLFIFSRIPMIFSKFSSPIWPVKLRQRLNQSPTKIYSFDFASPDKTPIVKNKRNTITVTNKIP